MTLRRFDGPVDGQSVLRTELGKRILHTTGFITPLGGAPQSGSPIPVFYLKLIDLQKNNPLECAVQIGWQYPILGGVEPGLASIKSFTDGRASSFEGLSHGLLAKRFLQASILADNKLGADAQVFEPRLLDCPALQYAALWLFGPKNFFVPLLDGKPPGTGPLNITPDITADLRRRALSRSVNSAPAGGSAPISPSN